MQHSKPCGHINVPAGRQIVQPDVGRIDERRETRRAHPQIIQQLCDKPKAHLIQTRQGIRHIPIRQGPRPHRRFNPPATIVIRGGVFVMSLGSATLFIGYGLSDFGDILTLPQWIAFAGTTALLLAPRR